MVAFRKATKMREAQQSVGWFASRNGRGQIESTLQYFHRVRKIIAF